MLNMYRGSDILMIRLFVFAGGLILHQLYKYNKQENFLREILLFYLFAEIYWCCRKLLNTGQICLKRTVSVENHYFLNGKSCARLS